MEKGVGVIAKVGANELSLLRSVACDVSHVTLTLRDLKILRHQLSSLERERTHYYP